MTENIEKFYLTRDGLKRIKEEQARILVLMESRGKENLPEFLHSDELNPEYAAFQEDMGILNKKIEEIINVLKNYEIIKSPAKENQNVVNLGAKVVIEIDGKAEEFTIVGTIESDPKLNKISDESPVGKAILGHKVGEELLIELIGKKVKIKKIKYE